MTRDDTPASEPTPSEDEIPDHDVCLHCGTRLDVPVIALAEHDNRVAEAYRRGLDEQIDTDVAATAEAVRRESLKTGARVEREACARVSDYYGETAFADITLSGRESTAGAMYCRKVSAAIRARGDK